jgi:hypothetical protein
MSTAKLKWSETRDSKQLLVKHSKIKIQLNLLIK